MKTYKVEVYDSGNKYWYLNGKLHREDGPAIEYANGGERWYMNGQLHREDGPAIEYANGGERWYMNGQLHREDGPAIEYTNGSKRWFLNDIEYTEAEFNAKMKPAKELSIGEIEKILGYKVKIVKD